MDIVGYTAYTHIGVWGQEISGYLDVANVFEPTYVLLGFGVTVVSKKLTISSFGVCFLLSVVFIVFLDVRCYGTIF